jgi:hypothetical protein
MDCAVQKMENMRFGIEKHGTSFAKGSAKGFAKGVAKGFAKGFDGRPVWAE